ncbi:MAG: potassium channel protein [Candidatus Elarobacter sp.]
MSDLLILPRRLVIAAVSVIAVVAIGTVGYVVLEHWSWFDAFYMTITTITTVGGGEIAPLDVAGKWWTILVVAFGFGVLTYTLLALVGFVIEGHFNVAVEERRMRGRARRMNQHFILCGFGRVGREIAREFVKERIAFVVIDINQESLGRAAAEGFTVVHGNSADVDVLRTAGIERARGLVAAVDADADNIYVTLSARVLRRDLFIVARANREDSESKLRLAGADRVISPYTIGGRRMASIATRPTTVDFVDTVLSATNGQLLLEDLRIPSGSQWVGRTLATLFPDGDEAFVLAHKHEGIMHFRPGPETTLAAGDELVAAGPPAAIRALEQRISPARA